MLKGNGNNMKEILLVRLFCKECKDNLAKLLDFSIAHPEVNHEYLYTEEGHIYLTGNEKKHKEQ